MSTVVAPPKHSFLQPTALDMTVEPNTYVRGGWLMEPVLVQSWEEDVPYGEDTRKTYKRTMASAVVHVIDGVWPATNLYIRSRWLDGRRILYPVSKLGRVRVPLICRWDLAEGAPSQFVGLANEGPEVPLWVHPERVTEYILVFRKLPTGR